MRFTLGDPMTPPRRRHGLMVRLRTPRGRSCWHLSSLSFSRFPQILSLYPSSFALVSFFRVLLSVITTYKTLGWTVRCPRYCTLANEFTLERDTGLLPHSQARPPPDALLEGANGKETNSNFRKRIRESLMLPKMLHILVKETT